MAALRVFTRGLAIAKIAILARILVPAQFGIYGIATIVLGFFETLTETGINIFLIQDKQKIDEYVDSAWVVSIIRGVVISLAILLLIPVIIAFFHTPGAKEILLLVSLVPLIRGFVNPACIKFQKNLEFNKQFFYDSSLFLIDTTVAISVTFLTHSENSLIWGMIVAAFVEVFLSFIVFLPKPKFLFNGNRVSEVISKGKWITSASIFNYIFENADDIFVGRLLGTQALGIYGQAYRIASLPASEVSEVFGRVTFPVYSVIGGDKKRIRIAFLKTLLIICLFVFSFGAIVFFFPKQIVEILLGKNWLTMVPVLQLLAIYGAGKAVSNSFFSMFLGIEKQKIITLATFIRAVVLSAGIYPLITIFGILGAGYAAIISVIASLPFLVYYSWKYLK